VSLISTLQLLNGVFEECNISVSKALCIKLAARIETLKGVGKLTPPNYMLTHLTQIYTECTAKAVEGRLYSWKKKNVSGGGSTTTTPVKPPRKTAVKTPRSRAKKKALTPVESSADEASPDGLLEYDEQLASPSAGRGSNKRARSTPRSYVESGSSDESNDYVPCAKRIKAEPKNEKDVAFDEVEL
jgi:hypothetical protein